MVIGCAVLLTTVARAKDKPRIQIQVVGTQTGERQAAFTIPGTATQSTTNCNGTATATGIGGLATANGTTNCTTTTNPGVPPRTVVRSIPQAYVHAIMPDGRRITVWCQAGLRRCTTLSPGSYTAEIDGNSLWIYAYELGDKQHKLKYRYVGGW